MDKETERYIELIKNAQEEFSDEYFVFAIPGFLTKKFIAYCAMKRDLELVTKYIALLKNNTNNMTVKSSLTFSLISLYGKCFTDASKNKYPKLEPKNLFKNQEDYLRIHKFLMDLRHQFISHRGETESEIGIAFMLMPKKGDNRSQIRYSQFKQFSFNQSKLSEIKILIEFIISKLDDKIKKSGQKIYDGFFKLYTPEQIKSMMMNNIKDNVSEK